MTDGPRRQTHRQVGVARLQWTEQTDRWTVGRMDRRTGGRRGMSGRTDGQAGQAYRPTHRQNWDRCDHSTCHPHKSHGPDRAATEAEAGRQMDRQTDRRTIGQAWVQTGLPLCACARIGRTRGTQQVWRANL